MRTYKTYTQDKFSHIDTEIKVGIFEGKTFQTILNEDRDYLDEMQDEGWDMPILVETMREVYINNLESLPEQFNDLKRGLSFENSMTLADYMDDDTPDIEEPLPEPEPYF